MIEFFSASALLLVLLNPFLVIIYLIDAVQKLQYYEFVKVMLRASLISIAVFCCFAALGDAIFSDLLHADFASFQIFGGIVFLLIGLEFVFNGPKAIKILRGDSKFLAGAIAMPVLIGPGTISASVLIGKHNEVVFACLSIVFAIVVSVIIIIALKALHDYVRPRREPLIERYIEIMGRITALFVGTISIQMIMEGVGSWLDKL